MEAARWQVDDQYMQDGTSLSVKLTSAQPVTGDFMALSRSSNLIETFE